MTKFFSPINNSIERYNIACILAKLYSVAGESQLMTSKSTEFNSTHESIAFLYPIINLFPLKYV